MLRRIAIELGSMCGDLAGWTNEREILQCIIVGFVLAHPVILMGVWLWKFLLWCL